jgi:hypothetical protein
MKRLNIIGKLKDARGMTMMELIFASTVLFGAIMTMLAMFTTAIDILEFTTTRSIATQVANEELENVRSMDYEQVYNAVPDTWPDDPNLDATATPPLYTDVRDDGVSVSRQIVTGDTGGLHMERHVVRKGIQFTVRTYILWVADTAGVTTPYKRLLTKVTWKKPGVQGEVVLSNNYAKQDHREPRPSVEIIGVISTNYNYFISASDATKDPRQPTMLGMDDSIRGPLPDEAQTPVVHVRAQANSAKAIGIDRVEFTLYNPAGDKVVEGQSTVPDANDFYTWELNTTEMIALPGDVQVPRTPDGMGYLIKAEAFDKYPPEVEGDLQKSDVSTMRVNIDNTPPAPIAVPDVVDQAAKRLDVTWQYAPAAGDQVPAISRFIIMRRVGGVGNEVQSQRAALPGNHSLFQGDKYLFHDVNIADRGNYKIIVVDSAGNQTESIWSNRDRTAKSGETEPPTIPGNFAVDAAGWKAVDLSWSPSTDNVGVLGYMFRAADVQGNWMIIGQTKQTVGDPIYYRDIGLKPGQTYWYQPQAFDAEGNASAWGTAVSVDMPMR